MSRGGKAIGVLLLVLIAASALFAASFPLQWWNLSLSELRERYERPQSRFLSIDGVDIHYQDEGRRDGPPIIMLHGNFGSLWTYDDWVPVLGDRYRLIRFDSPLAGLSGADPSGDYSIERRIFLMRSLLNHLEITRFFLVATSFNAPTAFRVAAEQPQSVPGLVLGNAGGLPRAPDSTLNRPPQNPFTAWLRQYYFPRRFFEERLPGLLPNPDRRGEDVIDQFHLMVNAEGRPRDGAEILRQFDSQDAQRYLERITVPVLLQWTTSGAEPLLVDRDLVRYQQWLSSAPVSTIEYADAGHMLYQNSPRKTAGDARRFFDAVLAEATAAPDP